MNQDENLQVPRLAAGILDDLNVPYVLGGSLTSIACGMPRTTQDADFVADIRPDDVSQFIAALGNE